MKTSICLTHFYFGVIVHTQWMKSFTCMHYKLRNFTAIGKSEMWNHIQFLQALINVDVSNAANGNIKWVTEHLSSVPSFLSMQWLHTQLLTVLLNSAIFSSDDTHCNFLGLTYSHLIPNGSNVLQNNNLPSHSFIKNFLLYK